MATSLRDIPGAKGRPGRRRQRDSWSALGEGPRPTVLVDPRQALGRPPARAWGSRWSSPRRGRLSTSDKVLICVAAAVVLFLAKAVWEVTRVDVEVTGVHDGAALTFEEAQELAVRWDVRPAGSLGSATLVLDGKILDEAEALDDGFRWKPDRPLNPGVHRLELTVPRPILPESEFRWTFTIDATPPKIETPALLPERGFEDAVIVAGAVVDPGDTDVVFTANGEEVELDDEGRFEIAYDRPPAGPVLLEATDAAGHVAKHEVFIPIERPRVRGVHMTAISWEVDHLREEVFRLIDEGKIDAVELDLKDEGGEVGYDSKVPLARQIGAVKKYYDLDEAVEVLHDKGVRVIGRVVAFRDPILAAAAWDKRDEDWVVQRPDGSAHGAYGGFTNLAHPAVQDYNIDIAMEAVEAGVDEILWDYVRRPEGDLEQMAFPGLEGSVETGVVEFLSKSHRLLRAEGVYQGASVFGIAAARPAAIGQNVPRIARHVDYIAPMVYPSLWVPHEYRVRNPAKEPYAIVTRALQDFQEKTAGTGVLVTPWLQDFSLDGVTYGDIHVRDQIKAAQDLGIGDFLLWSPRVVYHDRFVPTH